MKVLFNTLSVVEGVWEDPGEGLCGAGPALAPHPCIEEISGSVIVALDSETDVKLVLSGGQSGSDLRRELYLLLNEEEPNDIRITKWSMSALDSSIVCEVEEFNAQNWKPGREEYE